MSGIRQAPWICGPLPRPLRQCFSLNQAHLQADGGNLYVAIDVEAIVFGGENHGTVVHQRNVEALRVFYLAFKGGYELAILREDGEIEVVVVVGDGDLASPVDAHSNRVVCYPFAADLPEEVAFVVEDLDAVGSVVADEDLLPVVDDHPVGELEVLRAAELVQHVAKLVEDDHPHYLALHHDDPAFVVNANSARMLKDVRAKLSHKLPVLVVYLDLVRRRPLGNNDIARSLHNCHAIRIEKLAVTLSDLAKLELEPSLFVKDLDPVVVRIRHNYVVLRVDGDPAGLGELPLEDAELSELAVIDHLLPLDLAFGRVECAVAAAAVGIVLHLGGAWRHWGRVDCSL